MLWCFGVLAGKSHKFLRKSKKTGNSRSKTKHKPLDALTVIQNLKTKSVADTSVAQTRVADWAVKVGVEAKILKTREKENKGFHQKSLWDWRGRIEHDTIECHPHERYVDYLGGKISSFWVEKGGTNGTPKTDMYTKDFNISLKKKGGSQLASGGTGETIASFYAALQYMGVDRNAKKDIDKIMTQIENKFS